MGFRSILHWSLFVMLIVPLGILSCQDCTDCGPSTAEPYVNFQFFNIDSLVKVEDTLLVLEDSLDAVLVGIDTGNAELDSIRIGLENEIDTYEQVKQDIENGKIKIDEVWGPNGEGPLYFRDSLTNDSLTTFPFPLDMNYDSCSFIIRINDMDDRVAVSYVREEDYANYRILVRIYELEVIESSYDSVKVICDQNECNSNETKVYLYF